MASVRALRAVSIPLLSLLASPAAAAPTTDALDALEGEVQPVIDRSIDVVQRVRVGRGGLDEKATIDRYQDAVYAYLTGQWRQAAEGLFVLVTRGVLDGVGLRAEGEWYLADSLREVGNRDMAIAWYEAILAQAGHPFRTDAVRELLQLYAADPASDDFERLFRAEILGGRVEASDLVLYSVGKAFHIRGDALRAKSYFDQVPPESPWYHRARYWLGAMLVASGDPAQLSDALAIFQDLSMLSVDTPEDRDVLDLSILAQGRILDALGRFEQAAAAYGRLSGDSRYLQDQLYELVWVLISQERWEEALATVEVFLLAFPEHPDAAALRLVEGHLRFREDRFDDALAAYEEVVEDYVPVRDRFERLARTARVPVARMSELRVDPAAPPSDEDDPTAELPPYAISLLFDDVDLDRTLDLYDDVRGQARMVDESVRIVSELEGAFGDLGEVSPVDSVRIGSLQGRLEGLAARLELVDAEIAWIDEQGGGTAGLTATHGDLKGRVNDRLRRAADVRTALEQGQGTAGSGLATLYGERARIDDLAAEVADLAAAAEAAREAAGIQVDRDAASVRLRVMHTSLANADERFVRALDASDDMDVDGYQVLRDAFRVERHAVREQRGEIALEIDDTERLASALLARSFREVADVFEGSIMGADMGVVNVAWTRWVRAGEERKRTIEEKNAVIGDLERRYGFVRQKLEQ